MQLRHERGATVSMAVAVAVVVAVAVAVAVANLPCFPYPCFHAFAGGVHARGGEGGREGGREGGGQKKGGGSSVAR